MEVVVIYKKKRKIIKPQQPQPKKDAA